MLRAVMTCRLNACFGLTGFSLAIDLVLDTPLRSSSRIPVLSAPSMMPRLEWAA
jgi:hypothetical protein